MSILINAQTRLLVQGITGRQGRFHTTQMLAYGTNVVAGVTPGKGGQTVLGVPVFNVLEGGYSQELPVLVLAYLKGLTHASSA